jgi:hypothetical protein
MIPAEFGAIAWDEGYLMSLDEAVAYALESGVPVQSRHQRAITG